MNRIIRPMGRVVKEIRIQSDEAGTINVHPWNIDPNGNRTPMDPREMLLGLMKICMDTCATLLGAIDGANIGPIKGGADGQQQTENKDGNNKVS